MARAALTPAPPGGAIGALALGHGVHIRTGVWRAAKARAGVLLLGGRAEFIEKHHETIGELLGRGFDVFTFDWPGQGGSSRLLADPQKGHIGDFADYVAALDRFITEVVTRRGPLYGLAHSMGAHCLLRYLHDRPGVIERAVFCAMLAGLQLSAAQRLLCHLAVRAGLDERYAPGQHPFNEADRRFAGNRLTHDRARFDEYLAWLDRKPALQLGGVTWGWLDAALRSFALISAPGYPEAIASRVLMVRAGADRVVSNRAQARLAARLPRAKMITLEEARHEILHENDALRARFWRAFDRFIPATPPSPEHAPADHPPQ
jgi:lysophospholipase